MIRRLALLVALPLLVPAAAVAGPDPSSLPQGDPPTVTWQSGLTVHAASGRTVRLPLRPSQAGYQVLGRRGGEWVVATPGYDGEVLAVRGRHVRTVWTHTYDENDTSYTLAERGSLVAEWNYDRSGATSVVVFDLHGKTVAERSWGSPVVPLDFVGDTILITKAHKTQTWTVPGKPVDVAPDASFGDLQGDLLFVDVTTDASGPTTLSSPGAPAWTSDSFMPRRLSPDGRYVAGLSYDGRLTIQVRAVADGTVLPVPAFRTGFYDGDGPALAWEPDGDLLVEVRSTQGRALVRCGMDGGCARVTLWVKGQHLGFPG